MSKLRHHRVRSMPAETLDDLRARRDRVYTRYVQGEMAIEAMRAQIKKLDEIIARREEAEGDA